LQVLDAYLGGREGFLDSHGGAVITSFLSIQLLLKVNVKPVMTSQVLEKLSLLGVTGFEELLSKFLTGGPGTLDLEAVQRCIDDGVLKLSEEVRTRLRAPGACAWAFYRAATGRDLVSGDDPENTIQVRPDLLLNHGRFQLSSL
jgi:hypothetical protein